ncbi:phage tail protein [Dyella sp.]|uniref:phage tail protein n=1 Tax=Dyella sp. TaxID=1869338 RepID=UPI002ED24D44
MSTNYIGEIQLFGFNFAPQGWALCQGQTLQISQFSSLYALLGVSYGGNGTSNFQLPNFANRTACSQGQGPGLSQRQVGAATGTDSVALTIDEMPAHNHLVSLYSQADATKRTGMPTNGVYLSNSHNTSTLPYTAPPANSAFAPQALVQTGSGLPHENRQPFLAVNFCIALEGMFPSFQ